MSIAATDLGGPQNNVAKLFQLLVKAIDTNKDGNLSEGEFAAFLAKLTDGVSTSDGKHASPGSTTSTASTASTSMASVTWGAQVEPTTGATLIDPSTWNDNNAPYGVTYAGFSPQNHTELTVADLSKPLNAKYAAYDYMVSNRIQPTHDWAPGVADAMNKQFNTTIFYALDGETLAYGDEYIHTAENGRGMPRGTYNPNATGEFLWGAINT